MTEIVVVAQPNGTFRVDVRSDGSATTHVVSVPAGYLAALGCDDVPTEQLIQASFLFLLEREPPNSILRRFRLDQIADYFPDYPSTIGQRLRSRD
ncbi:MAG: hypothetical protein WAL35_04400 [Acidimicrobiales bacterium]